MRWIKNLFIWIVVGGAAGAASTLSLPDRQKQTATSGSTIEALRACRKEIERIIAEDREDARLAQSDVNLALAKANRFLVEFDGIAKNAKSLRNLIEHDKVELEKRSQKHRSVQAQFDGLNARAAILASQAAEIESRILSVENSIVEFNRRLAELEQLAAAHRKTISKLTKRRDVLKLNHDRFKGMWEEEERERERRKRQQESEI